MKLTRRQLLLGGLTVGVAATGIHEAIRLRRAYAQQVTLTDLALQSPSILSGIHRSASR